MENNFIVNSLLAVFLVIIGFMFISGLWGTRRKIKWLGSDIDHVLFPKGVSDEVILFADRLSANICFVMALLTFLNGLFAEFVKIPNVSMIFVVIGVLLTWPIKIICIIMYKNKG